MMVECVAAVLSTPCLTPCLRPPVNTQLHCRMRQVLPHSCAFRTLPHVSPPACVHPSTLHWLQNEAGAASQLPPIDSASPPAFMSACKHSSVHRMRQVLPHSCWVYSPADAAAPPAAAPTPQQQQHPVGATAAQNSQHRQQQQQQRQLELGALNSNSSSSSKRVSCCGLPSKRRWVYLRVMCMHLRGSCRQHLSKHWR